MDDIQTNLSSLLDSYPPDQRSAAVDQMISEVFEDLVVRFGSVEAIKIVRAVARSVTDVEPK